MTGACATRLSGMPTAVRRSSPSPPAPGGKGVCDAGWICEEHPDRPYPHDDCAGPAMLCRTPGCPHLALSPHEVYDVIRETLLSLRLSSTESEKINGLLATTGELVGSHQDGLGHAKPDPARRLLVDHEPSPPADRGTG
jgi:hypothetical protein